MVVDLRPSSVQRLHWALMESKRITTDARQMEGVPLLARAPDSRRDHRSLSLMVNY